MPERVDLLQHIAQSTADASDLIDLLDRVRPLLESTHPVARLSVAMHHDDHGSLRWVQERRIPLCQPDTSRPLLPSDRTLSERGVGSYVLVPILAGGEVIAALVVESGDARSPWCQETELLELVARQLAGAVVAHFRAEAARRVTEQKDELLAVVAHELRSPLTSITGFVKLLLSVDHMGVEEMREVLRIVERSAHRLARIADDLGSARGSDDVLLHIEPVPTDLAAVLRDAAGEMGSVAARLDAPPAVPVLGDPQRLAQMIVNLLSNAERYGAPPVHVSLKVDGAVARLVVRDEGQGFPSGFLDRVFTKYATATPHLGTGIGLWLVRRIAEAHSGSVSAGNHDAGGAEVAVVLPVSPPAA